MSPLPPFSILIPAKNEALGLQALLPRLTELYPHTEIVVINDGSTDATLSLCALFPTVRVLSHPYPKGNGACLKTAARHAQHPWWVLMDADGQHKPEDIPLLLGPLIQGYAMAVGARRALAHPNLPRGLANLLYNRLASYVVDHPVLDLTSGFRAVEADKLRSFLPLLPNGFSSPTTLTLAFFRSGYSVAYCPITTGSRKGKSHLKIGYEGPRFLLILAKITMLYAPLKIFVPGAALFAFASAWAFYRGSLSWIVWISLSILLFLGGLWAEQKTLRLYLNAD